MESKKTPQANLRKKSTLYLSVGFMLSLAFALTAFEWRSYGESSVDLDDLSMVDEDDELIEITYQPKRPKPPVIPREIIEIPDNEEPEDTEVIVIDLEDPTVDIGPIIEDIPEEIADTIHIVAEVMPAPVGGMQAFYKYIGKNLKYPSVARRIGIEGKVYMYFVIDRDGSLSDVKVLKGIGGGCDEEALRVVEAAPKWNPGKQRGVPVRVKMTLPIIFTLN
ncbi:MAG: energy transducer TonB [Cyclobacteriaceae bacterium]